mmetsp:Transcript_93951/g.223567  ORF Transcript_93951/g.223567 Transcript_93951/m.223567 type:complete len:215 (-) Transcript_93951:15-659(-)
MLESVGTLRHFFFSGSLASARSASSFLVLLVVSTCTWGCINRKTLAQRKLTFIEASASLLFISSCLARAAISQPKFAAGTTCSNPSCSASAVTSCSPSRKRASSPASTRSQPRSSATAALPRNPVATPISGRRIFWRILQTSSAWSWSKSCGASCEAPSTTRKMAGGKAPCSQAWSCCQALLREEPAPGLGETGSTKARAMNLIFWRGTREPLR